MEKRMRANGKSRQVGKQAILRLLHREVELLHQIKGEITRHAGIEEIFRENHQHKDGKRPVDRPLRKRTNAHRPLTMGSPDLHQYQFIPISDARQQHGSQQRRQCKPPNSMLPVRYDNQRRQQRPNGAAAIPADLKNGLRQTFPPTRRQLCHPRSLRMEHRRTATNQRNGKQDRQEIGRKSQRHQPHERETHAYRQRIGLRMPVGITSHKRLQYRRSQLEHQRNDANLRKRKPIFIFQQRIESRDNRLNHIVQ